MNSGKPSRFAGILVSQRRQPSAVALRMRPMLQILIYRDGYAGAGSYLVGAIHESPADPVRFSRHETSLKTNKYGRFAIQNSIVRTGA